jgi:hypothetical protein
MAQLDVTAMRGALTASGITILDCSLLVIRTLPAIRIVGKQLGTPFGTHYFGSVLIPLAACSYTVNVKCAEAGSQESARRSLST